MNKEEKRRKFHESLLKMLYPPPPPPPPPPQEETPLNISREGFSDDLVDDEENSSSSSSDGGQEKLTRAQRKRRRKKKLSQAASQRRSIIGPMLPAPPTDHAPVLDETQPVRHNAAEVSGCGFRNSEEKGASSNQNKLKQRRMAKKLTRDIQEQKDSLVTGACKIDVQPCTK